MVEEQKCFGCGKKGHSSATCPNKKKKGWSEKAGAAADASVKKTRSKCSHYGKLGCKEDDCWKKHPHKVPSRSSTEASGKFLDEEVLVCNIAQDEIPYVTQDTEAAYYCVPVIEDRRWEDLDSWMGLVESLMGQQGPLMADPCKEEHVMSNNKKANDAGKKDWLELQEQANVHDRQICRLWQPCCMSSIWHFKRLSCLQSSYVGL